MGRNKVIDDAGVLAAAREVFRANGHGASTRDIARAAGVSQAALYQRFGSKDELFFLAMTPERFDLDAVLGPYPPADAFKDLVAIANRLVVHLREFMPTLLTVLAAPRHDVERLREWHGQLPFPALIRALAERLRAMSADGLIRAVQPQAAAIVLVSTLHTYAMFGDLDHPGRQPGLTEVIRVLWLGLAPG